MKLTLSSEVKQAYPDLKVSIVEISLSKVKFNQELMDLKRKLENKIREYPDDLPNIKKYNKFYKKFSSKVPMEYQIKSILNNKEIPMFHPVLTCMFMAELKNIMLTAGHDLDKLKDTIEVNLAKGTEEYTKINNQLQKLKKNDIYATDGNIISSVLYGPDASTKITKETKNFLFMCYSFNLNNEDIENHMNDIINYLRTLVKDNSTLSLKPFSPRA